MKILFKSFLLVFAILIATEGYAQRHEGNGNQKINRKALVERNNPRVQSMDTLSSLTVGNGEFAYTVDATGLQSFPEYYEQGVCLGTQSQWGWHSFPNPEGYKPEEALRAHDFGHKSKKELYSCQFREPGRQHDASEWLRKNAHRLHLGVVGFDFGKGVKATDIKDIQQNLNMWEGVISSHFSLAGKQYDVHTTCHPTRDMIAVSIDYQPSFDGKEGTKTPVCIRLPYASGGHVDGACDWKSTDKHTSSIIMKSADVQSQRTRMVPQNYAVIRHTLDDTSYDIIVRWHGESKLTAAGNHKFLLQPAGTHLEFTVEFAEAKERGAEFFEDASLAGYGAVEDASRMSWRKFWTEGAAVDFSHCRDARAKELERRVVLSQYLLALQSAGSMPPQETGLTMNSWYGKFHLEMILWHEAWLPLWGHADKLSRTLEWYFKAEPVAREIAQRQGFDGVRWMKMTDPTGMEAPSNVGSFLIWQQPHLTYLAELVYRSNHDDAFLKRFYPLVEETTKFMYSFANYDKKNKRYILKGHIPAQESLKASVTFNAPFELSQWHYTMQVAQQWRERLGQQRNKNWDKMIDQLSVLAFNSDSLYLAAESATDTYQDIKATSDHPALLGALGFFPDSRLINKRVMNHTLDWIVSNWNWPTSWGWDFPMTAMTATRLHQPEKAVGALMLGMQKNTYLNNGHNYQDDRLRIYLPGNGGLLSAIALMCAGWDGCEEHNPGFPKDGNWDVRWEGLKPMP